jgi:hypothetical protein
VVFFLGRFLLFTCSMNGSHAQFAKPSNEDAVLVKTWKGGEGRIAEQQLSISLEKKIKEYEIDVYDSLRQRHFRMQMRHASVNTVSTPGIDCLVVFLKEVTKDPKINGGSIIGPNLLSVEGPGVGDNVPREEWADVFCPVEKPRNFLDGALYPIKAERKFLIENFFLTLRVISYGYNEKENSLDHLELKIELGNQK